MKIDLDLGGLLWGIYKSIWKSISIVCVTLLIHPFIPLWKEKLKGRSEVYGMENKKQTIENKKQAELNNWINILVESTFCF